MIHNIDISPELECIEKECDCPTPNMKFIKNMVNNIWEKIGHKWGNMKYTKTILLIAITTLILSIATVYKITHWWGNMIQQGTSQRGKIECYRNQFGDMCFTAPCCKKSSKSCKYEGYHGDVMSSKELLKCYTFWEIIKIKVLKWWGKENETIWIL